MGDVGSNGEAARAERVRRAAQRLFVAPADGYLSAFGDKKTRGRETDAAIAAGNQRVFVV